jgi:hypothetical protein
MGIKSHIKHKTKNAICQGISRLFKFFYPPLLDIAGNRVIFTIIRCKIYKYTGFF